MLTNQPQTLIQEQVLDLTESVLSRKENKDLPFKIENDMILYHNDNGGLDGLVGGDVDVDDKHLKDKLKSVRDAVDKFILSFKEEYNGLPTSQFLFAAMPWYADFLNVERLYNVSKGELTKTVVLTQAEALEKSREIIDQEVFEAEIRDNRIVYTGPRGKAADFLVDFETQVALQEPDLLNHLPKISREVDTKALRADIIKLRQLHKKGIIDEDFNIVHNKKLGLKRRLKRLNQGLRHFYISPPVKKDRISLTKIGLSAMAVFGLAFGAYTLASDSDSDSDDSGLEEMLDSDDVVSAEASNPLTSTILEPNIDFLDEIESKLNALEARGGDDKQYIELYENFDDGQHRSWDVLSGKSNVIAGNLDGTGSKLLNLTAESGDAVMMYDDGLDFENYLWNVDFNLKESNSTYPVVNFFLRSQSETDLNNTYKLVIKPGVDRMDFIKVEDGEESVLKSISHDFDVGSTYALKFQMEGNKIDIFSGRGSNPSKIMSVTDDTFKKGTVGLGISAPDTYFARALVDNIEIKTSELKPAYGKHSMTKFFDFGEGDLFKKSGRWSVYNGLLKQTTMDSTEDNWEGRAFYGNLSWKDYTVTVDFEKTEGDDGIALAFRAMGKDNFYALRYSEGGSSDKYWEIVKHAPSGFERLARGELDSDGLDEGKQRLKVRVSGDTFNAYIEEDGEFTKVVSARDTTYKSGGIGLLTDNGKYNFDRINVYGYTTMEKDEVLDIALNEAVKIANPGTQSAPVTYGKYIVYEDNRGGDWNIFVFDTEAGVEFPITTNFYDQRYPDIYKDKIVYQSDESGNWDIMEYNFKTGETKRITNSDNSEGNPSVFDKFAVYNYYAKETLLPDSWSMSGGFYKSGEEYWSDYGHNIDSKLTSSTEFDLSAAINPKLVFTMYNHNHDSTGDICYTEISADGSTWDTIFTEEGSGAHTWQTKTIDIPSEYIDKQVYFRFRLIMDNNAEYYHGFGVKDIKIKGSSITDTVKIKNKDTETETSLGRGTIPNIDEKSVTWYDYDVKKLKYYDLFESETKEILSYDSDVFPKTYGDNILYQKSDGLYIYDIEKEEHIRVVSSSDIRSNSHDIYQDNIAWVEKRNGTYDVFLKNLTSGAEVRIESTGNDEYYADISKGIVAWQRGGDVYAYKFREILDDPEPGQVPPEIVDVAVGLNGTKLDIKAGLFDLDGDQQEKMFYSILDGDDVKLQENLNLADVSEFYSNFTKTLDVSSMPKGKKLTLRLWGYDGEDRLAEFEKDFEISPVGTAPKINQFDLRQSGKTVYLTSKIFDEDSDLESYTYKIIDRSNQTVLSGSLNLDSLTNKNYTLSKTLDVSSLEEGAYNIDVVFTDENGNQVEQSDFFTLRDGLNHLPEFTQFRQSLDDKNLTLEATLYDADGDLKDFMVLEVLKDGETELIDYLDKGEVTNKTRSFSKEIDLSEYTGEVVVEIWGYDKNDSFAKKRVIVDLAEEEITHLPEFKYYELAVNQDSIKANITVSDEDGDLESQLLYKIEDADNDNELITLQRLKLIKEINNYAVFADDIDISELREGGKYNLTFIVDDKSLNRVEKVTQFIVPVTPEEPEPENNVPVVKEFSFKVNKEKEELELDAYIAHEDDNLNNKLDYEILDGSLARVLSGKINLVEYKTGHYNFSEKEDISSLEQGEYFVKVSGSDTDGDDFEIIREFSIQRDEPEPEPENNIPELRDFSMNIGQDYAKFAIHVFDSDLDFVEQLNYTLKKDDSVVDSGEARLVSIGSGHYNFTFDRDLSDFEGGDKLVATFTGQDEKGASLEKRISFEVPTKEVEPEPEDYEPIFKEVSFNVQPGVLSLKAYIVDLDDNLVEENITYKILAENGTEIIFGVLNPVNYQTSNLNVSKDVNISSLDPETRYWLKLTINDENGNQAETTRSFVTPSQEYVPGNQSPKISSSSLESLEDKIEVKAHVFDKDDNLLTPVTYEIISSGEIIANGSFDINDYLEGEYNISKLIETSNFGPGDHKLRIRASDIAGAYAERDILFSISKEETDEPENNIPEITDLDFKVDPDGYLNLTLKVSDQDLDLSDLLYYEIQDENKTMSLSGYQNAAEINSGEYIFSARITTEGLEPGKYSFLIRPTDENGAIVEKLLNFAISEDFKPIEPEPEPGNTPPVAEDLGFTVTNEYIMFNAKIYDEEDNLDRMVYTIKDTNGTTILSGEYGARNSQSGYSNFLGNIDIVGLEPNTLYTLELTFSDSDGAAVHKTRTFNTLSEDLESEQVGRKYVPVEDIIHNRYFQVGALATIAGIILPVAYLKLHSRSALASLTHVSDDNPKLRRKDEED